MPENIGRYYNIWCKSLIQPAIIQDLKSKLAACVHFFLSSFRLQLWIIDQNCLENYLAKWNEDQRPKFVHPSADDPRTSSALHLLFADDICGLSADEMQKIEYLVDIRRISGRRISKFKPQHFVVGMIMAAGAWQPELCTCNIKYLHQTKSN